MADGNAVDVGIGATISVKVALGGPVVADVGGGEGMRMGCWARVSDVVRHEKSAAMSKRVMWRE